MNTIRPTLIGMAVVGLLSLAACNKEQTADLSVLPPPSTEPLPAPATPAATELLTFGAQLSGSAEVPPLQNQASGTLEATLEPGSLLLSWTLNHSGLSGPITGAHFHGPASAGQNASVVLPISGAADSPSSGSVTLSAAQAAELRAGNWYLNLHTAAHPDGEIRGQVQTRL
jgi:hypothetical protein